MIKQFALIAALFLAIDLDINKIARANKLKKEAERAYMDLNYKEAAEKYRILIEDMGETNDNAILNLAHAYYHLGQLGNASTFYNRLVLSEDKFVKSIALQQLGILAYKREDYDKAVVYFKESLRADYENEEARYNYELLKKKKLDKKIDPQENKDKQQKPEQKQSKEEQKQQEKQKQEQEAQQQKQDQPQPQQNPDKQSAEQSSKTQPNQDPGNKQQPDADKSKEDPNRANPQNQKDQEGEDKQVADKQKSAKDNESENGQNKARTEAERGRQLKGEETKVGVNKQQLEKMNLTEEKARMILDAMRSNEVQYIQQMQHKGTSKKPEKGKPDW